MNITDQEKFRSDFKRIVYLKGLITENATNLRKLHAWDKNGSHEKAILRSLEGRKELRAAFLEILNGRSYEDWREFSKKLTSLNTRLKSALAQKERCEQGINNLIF